MNEQERYNNIDMPFYKKEISPLLPPKVLDFHTHVWRIDQWYPQYIKQLKSVNEGMEETSGLSSEKSNALKYLVSDMDYSIDQLLGDGRRMFPDREYNAVFFGHPSPVVNTAVSNDYVARNSFLQGLFPLIIAGKGTVPIVFLKQQIIENGFLGYKVYLNWIGDNYGNVKIEDMIGIEEMKLADELGLIVLIHVPRSGRLADPEIQGGIQKYARRFPNARIVLAHCGRCYHPDEMKVAIGAIRKYENVYLDTSMVMDPTVLQIVFENIDSSRVLFATDYPVAAMRGRRVYVMDHWVDVVLEGYAESSYRVISNNINATFMVYEIILAIKRAAEMSGLTEVEMKRVFYDNGMELLNHVMKGQQLLKIQNRWK